MSQDDRTSDQFIREVDEEMRRDQLKALWDRFGALIIATCVLIVLVTAGWRGYVWWQERRAAEEGDRYLAAVEAEQAGRRDEAVAAFEALAAEGQPGYAALARLHLAAARAAAGDAAGAIAGFDAIAADPKVEAGLRDAARVRAALLALNTGDRAGAVARVEGLAVAGNPWRHAAREILGLTAYADGALAKSRQFFVDIQADAESPQNLRARAGRMVSLIDGEVVAPAT